MGFNADVAASIPAVEILGLGLGLGLGSHILKLVFQWCQVYLRYAWYRLSFGIGKCGLGLKRDFALGALISRKFFFVSHQLFHTIVYFICV